VGYPPIWEVADGLADEIVSIDHSRFASLYGERASPELRRWLEGADLTIAWTVRDAARALCAAGMRTVHASPYPPPGVHAAMWLLRTLGFSDDAAEIARRVVAIGRYWRDANVLEHRGTCFIHPGAGAAWKRWPATRFAAVADELAERGRDVAIVEGPADTGAVAELVSHTRRHHAYEVIHEPVLRRLASILAGGALYIGSDSGVTHLAAMAGVPTVALFGPTDPASWAPLGDVTLLRRCDRRTMVQGKIRVCEDPLCLEAISVHEVLESAIQYL
jgi:hypothetical protein